VACVAPSHARTRAENRAAELARAPTAWAQQLAPRRPFRGEPLACRGAEPRGDETFVPAWEFAVWID